MTKMYFRLYFRTFQESIENLPIQTMLIGETVITHHRVPKMTHIIQKAYTLFHLRYIN